MRQNNLYYYISGWSLPKVRKMLITRKTEKVSWVLMEFYFLIWMDANNIGVMTYDNIGL